MSDHMTTTGPDPVLLSDALKTFEALWSPRIVTRVNDYDVRVAKVRGEHVWHVHEETDEFFLVLDGVLDIALREAAWGADGHPRPGRGVRRPAHHLAPAVLDGRCVAPAVRAVRDVIGGRPARRGARPCRGDNRTRTGSLNTAGTAGLRAAAGPPSRSGSCGLEVRACGPHPRIPGSARRRARR